MGFDIRKTYPGEYIGSDDLGDKEWTLTISAVRTEPVKGSDDKRPVLVLRFSDAKKPWIANKGAMRCLVKMFGHDSDALVGHKITLYVSSFRGDPAIRLRGSPDISRPIKVRHKEDGKAVVFTMYPTGKNAPAPDPDPVTPDEAREIAGAEQGREG